MGDLLQQRRRQRAVALPAGQSESQRNTGCAAIRAHAEAAGMDVSAYMIAAAAAQMARDDAATASFAALDALNQAAIEEAAGDPEDEVPSFEELTAEDQAFVRRVLGNALEADDAGAS